MMSGGVWCASRSCAAVKPGSPRPARTAVSIRSYAAGCTGGSSTPVWARSASRPPAISAARSRSWRAAEIAGGRDALRAQTGVLLPPVHPAAYERMLTAVRAGLGEPGFTAAHDRLAHQTPPDIIAAVTGELTR